MKWTKEEINYLIDNYSKDISLRIILDRLKRTKRAVSHKASRLGLSRNRIPHNKPKDPLHRKIADKKYYEKNKVIIYKNKRIRLRNYKREIADMLGGQCSRCSYKKCLGALDFHHISNNKENEVTYFLSYGSKQKALKEAEKCILLCANCHRELHYKDL